MLRPFVPIHCVLASFAIGCGTADAASGAQSSFTVRDSAGIRIVESTEPAEDRPWVISDSPLFQVGNVSGRPEYELYRVRGALRLSDGSIVIANSGTGELRWYSLTGEFLHSAGGTGEGPGEFLALASVFHLADDSTAAWDRRLRRLSIFGANGAFVRSLQLPVLGPAPVGRFADATYLLSPSGFVIGASGPPRVERLPLDIYRYPEPEGPAEQLARLSGYEVVVTANEGGRGMRFARNPRQFGRNTFVAGGPSGWIVADNDRTEIQFRAPHGDLTVLARWTLPRRSVTARDLEADIAARVAQRDSPAGRRAARQLWERQPDPPSTMPAFDYPLLLDSEGNVWVKEYTPPAEDDANRFYVFGPDGVWLASPEVPVGMRPLAIGSDYVIGVGQGEFDVEVVSVHRLEKS